MKLTSFKMNNGKITIDGKEFKGSNVSISNNGEVTVDGVIQDGGVIDTVNIVIHGDVERLENTSGTVKAENVHSIKTLSGDIECGNVTGNVDTMSGDVECLNISGNVKTMSGDITHVKG